MTISLRGITLISQAIHPIGDYWLIAYCNVFYKVITKILASLLGPIFGSIVYRAQTVFVEGWSMMKNIHLAQELLKQYNHKRDVTQCLLKIDLRHMIWLIEIFLKAYLKGWDSLQDSLIG